MSRKKIEFEVVTPDEGIKKIVMIGKTTPPQLINQMGVHPDSKLFIEIPPFKQDEKLRNFRPIDAEGILIVPPGESSNGRV